MINVEDYIRQILKKKKWTYAKFAEEINKVKKESGIQTKTTKQNISNFLNRLDRHILGIRQLVIWEKALQLPNGSLTKMVEQPKTNKGLREFKEYKKKIWKNN